MDKYLIETSDIAMEGDIIEGLVAYEKRKILVHKIISAFPHMDRCSDPVMTIQVIGEEVS